MSQLYILASSNKAVSEWDPAGGPGLPPGALSALLAHFGDFQQKQRISMTIVENGDPRVLKIARV